MRKIIGFVSALLVGLSFSVSNPAVAAEITDFDGVYEAANNLLTTTCTGETTITQEVVLPPWYFDVVKGQIGQGQLGSITSTSGTATMTLSSTQLAGVSGVEMTGPVLFTIQRDGTVKVEGTLFSRYNQICTQTLALRAATQDAFRFTVDARYIVKRGEPAKISLCDPPQSTKCGWPKEPKNPSSTNPKASFSFSVAHFSFSSKECEPFGNKCGFLPRGLKLNLFTGKITGSPTVKPGKYPVRLCATEFSNGKRVCEGTTFVVR